MKEEKVQKELTEEMHKIETFIGVILRIGVFVSCFFMVTGLVLFLLTNQSSNTLDAFPIQIHDIFSGVLALKPNAMMMTGLFLLILTPVLRVFVSIFAFWIEKDYLYVRITFLVLVILLIAIFIGHIEG